MHIPTLIERKRDGHTLGDDEIAQLIAAYTTGDIPDYQMSAFAMAVYFRGMTAQETAALTRAMLQSGSQLTWPSDAPSRVDKHSTGGIGDKTSLIIAPLLACDGLWVPMISGRGLGITGGTLDKLDSIPGFRTRISEDEIHRCIRQTGCALAGQTDSLCPADKKLYSLRDVTATVPSIPLITASILGKKLAEGLNRLVLDVKYGSGAFMQSEADARALAQSMQDTAAHLGLGTTVQLHAMNEPTGHAAGNALEVIEAVECLQGRGPADLEEICIELAAAVSNSTREQLQKRLHDGSAWEKFQHIVAAQGGNPADLENLHQIHRAPVIRELKAPRAGRLTRMDARQVGLAVLYLGAGRSKAADQVDFAVGCDCIAKTGTQVSTGDILARIHARNESAASAAATTLMAGIELDGDC
ncbi:MAG: thymidine phosphorylase [Verrucomicrobiaceae bacterium]|nr:thymidine phosphorylase [Verrucomicrobiaceae bacterium]